ncbi:MAG: trigger factor [Chloroflexi bacterium]|nr:MAG: trigger factor [Chloroflexota bacterium]TME93052.1 MAG: trigger factor [Chloroflexota bacterium]
MPAELSVVTEPLPKSQVGLTIEVPAELVDATFERVLNRLVSKAKIEGFRPGRAPRQLVEARVGPAALREEVVDAIVPQVVQQAMREKSIDPIDNPDVEVIELERGRPARLKATISVMPQVTLGDTSKLIAPAEAIDVTDEMLERRLEDVREPLAEVTPVEREARMGDVAVIDVEVEADGAVVESETRKAMEAELKDGVLLPELLAVLPGTFVDETRETTVKFPDDYSEPKLAGKEATIRVTLRGVKEKVLPQLDDALAKQLSGGKQDTVDAYRAAVREELEEAARSMTRLAREQALVKALVDSSQVEVPEALVERELVTQLESMERSLGRQGLKLDRYLDYLGKTVPQWAADERPDAEARLKVDLILDEFARREGIDPTDEEVDTFLEEQAPRDEDLKGRVAELKQSASAKRYFASRLRRLKVLDRLNEIGIAAQPSETEAAKS